MKPCLASLFVMLLLVVVACDGDRGTARDVVADAATDLGQHDTAATDTGAGDTGRSDTAQASDLTDAQRDTSSETGPDGVDIDTTEVGDTTDPPLPTPSREGLIIRVDDQFWRNMDDLVFRVAAQHDVQLYLTVISANFYGDEAHRALGMEIVRHPDSFLQNAVVPLLERYADTGVIWAIDCMNEPEALVMGDTGNWETWGVSWDEMRAYLSACADVVHNHSNLQVSAGSGWHDWDNVQQGRYAGIGFDFYDYHTYHDSFALPAASTLGGSVPVIVGECGQASETVDDTLQLDAVRSCFDQAEAGGYLAALSWYYDRAGSTDKHAHLKPDGSWRPVRAAFEAHATSTATMGINLAWFGGAYDHDLGPNPLHPSWGVRYDHAEAEAVFANLDAVGIPLMRLWLFEGQEALPFHAVFEDFEQASPWTALGTGVTLRSTTQHTADGAQSLAVHIAATQPGWYGISRTWDAQTPLNLAPASSWQFTAHNALGLAVGVNLAMVVDGETYQTRSGATGGQLWLQDGAGSEHTVALDAATFDAQWAVQSAPDAGVPRPAEASLQRTSELRLRVYLSAAQVPVDGDLFIDAIRVR